MHSRYMQSSLLAACFVSCQLSAANSANGLSKIQQKEIRHCGGFYRKEWIPAELHMNTELHVCDTAAFSTALVSHADSSVQNA